ncbi:hypothetical protein P153DRAFT_91315 [Dothidotthia symphoricarpi CBS 119687]|uniref:Uncharacterized protein n=1 Tax=Dothidotthia symphoricarpi CBS 119687 TaxID=1392245 RepID=A0A6A6A111_9PLEO|nr:uncharacterized protein P153DRAFT_91315 [Dothidotthia symphoricarpi CBS 119687]KAF2125692.1 hypothetical protein P153DRAFT_91315 [Dothidotthia symphoricarpi CBS 119687]
MTILVFFLLIASNCLSSIAAGIPRLAISDVERRYDPLEHKGICECPLSGPSGTCIIKPLAGSDPNDAWSSTCEGLGFYYTCGGSYNSPNCNICAQAYPGNTRPHPEIIDCPGMKWCSGDQGKTFHQCQLHEEPYHPDIHVGVRVGATTFDIGNYDFDQITSDIAKSCQKDGCDAGTTEEIDFENLDSSSKIVPTKGSLTIQGFANSDQKMVDNLIATVGAVLQSSKQCQTVRATQCSLKRETPSIAHGCGPVEFEKCSMVNYVQATAYDIDSNIKAQITFSGESTDIKFPCDTFLGLISAAASAADADPAIQGGIAVASIVCTLFTGGDD